MGSTHLLLDHEKPSQRVIQDIPSHLSCAIERRGALLAKVVNCGGSLLSRRYRSIGRETLEIAETAPLGLLRDILEYKEEDSDPIVRLAWPPEDDEDGARQAILSQLNENSIELLQPIEDRSRRIRHLATGKGPTSLNHVASQRLSHEEHNDFGAQLDALCSSGWMFLRHQKSFCDAEAFHAVRQYRDHGKMYDAFEVDAGDTAVVDADQVDMAAIASLLTARLDLPSKVDISTLNLRATATHPASVLVIIRHAGPLSSVFNHKDGGLRSTIYFRPPNEASLVWTPKESLIEACAASPQVRRTIAETFAEVVFKTDLSKKPLSWRYYDLSRFHASLALPLPLWGDIDIAEAKVIEVEMRLGNWARRLSLRVTVDDDIEDVAKRWLGGSRLLKRVEGFSRLNVAVKYTRPQDRRARSFEISFGDRRSNLQSKLDPEERDLGYRLLQHWGILNRLKPLEYSEVAEILPSLLALHDQPEDEIAGGLLRRLGLDARRLLDAGVIAYKARQNMVLPDDDSDDIVIEASPRDGEVHASGGYGEPTGSLAAEDVRIYVLKRDWLEEIVLTALTPLVGKGPFNQLSADLASLGIWRHDGGAIPLYLVRRLDHPDRLQTSDLALRSRQGAGVGIVLSSVKTDLTHLGPNVVIPVADILTNGTLGDEARSTLLHRLAVGRWLALGGAEVVLMKFASQTAMLYIPGKIPLAVIGPKQIVVLQRLVDAHKAGGPGVVTGKLIEGSGVKSPADAWPSLVRNSVVGVYFENAQHGLWRLKVD